jgi:hypothetical protein
MKETSEQDCKNNMLGWKQVTRKFFKDFQLRWKLFKPVRRGIVVVLIPVLFILILSIVLYPPWLTNYQTKLSLLALTVVGVVGFLSNFFQIFIQVILSYQKAEQLYRSFQRVTNTSKMVLRPKLKGIPQLLPKEETNIILRELFENSRSVLLTGEAGVGKSGIAVEIIENAVQKNLFYLLIDAKALSRVQEAGDLKNFFAVEESFYEAVRRLGGFADTIIVVDQIDNIVGTPSCDVVIELLTTCASFDGVLVVAVTRHREANEQGAVRPLLESGFVDVVCQPITTDLVVHVLSSVGVTEIPASLFAITTNLLNLDLICEVIKTCGWQDLSGIQDIVDLWESYRLMLIERENYANYHGEDFIVEAVRLARIGLLSPDRGFDLEYPLNHIHSRLISGNIIKQIFGRRYQFSHDKLQDYLYAWDACERIRFPNHINEEIGELHGRNVMIWMRDIYQRKDASLYEHFLEEALNG